MADTPPNDPAAAGAGHLVVCPHCRAVYDTAESMEGKRIRCRFCGHIWRQDNQAAEKISRSLHEAVSGTTHLGSTLLGAADHASTVGQLVAQTAAEPRPPASEWVGRQIGRYLIKAVIGQGAMGYVYEAMDTELRRPVAVKLLPPRSDARETLGQRMFVQEARTAARLQHPNIVTVYDVGQDNGTYFLAMELVRGLTLMTLVKQRGPLPIEQACYILAHAARAVAIGHRNGVVHRDVKPGNILLDESGLVKLTDFGLADVADADGSTRVSGVALGTPGWISPEVARGEPALPASDIYGLGLTLYFALTAKRLIRAKTKSGMIQIQREAKSVQIEDLPASWPPKLREIVSRCLAAQPGERYQSAADLAVDLFSVPSGARSGSTAEAGTIDIGRRRGGFAWIVLGLVAAVAAAIWYAGKLPF